MFKIVATIVYLGSPQKAYVLSQNQEPRILNSLELEASATRKGYDNSFMKREKKRKSQRKHNRYSIHNLLLLPILVDSELSSESSRQIKRFSDFQIESR